MWNSCESMKFITGCFANFGNMVIKVSFIIKCYTEKFFKSCISINICLKIFIFTSEKMTLNRIGFYSIIFKPFRNGFVGFLWLNYYYLWSFSYSVLYVIVYVACKIYTSLQKRNIKMWYKSGPSIDPCGTPATISNHQLNWSFIWTLCL